jgi:hypothetical protein
MNIKMLEMVNYIRVNGIRKLEKEMVLVYNFGLMGLNMKECGGKTKQMAEVE